jgi:UDP-N-acetylmuramoyl-L-alanyl-D-glutamate--2,6-diaminopimelate ligase
MVAKLLPESFRVIYRIFISSIAEIRYGFPSRKVKLIGVTGTSGKSTTSSMIYHVLEENGFKVGLVSTVGAKAGRKNIDTGLHVTTPNPWQFKKILSVMVEMEIEYVVVEASSHALAQGRLGNAKFVHSVFTNIKQDHLDWHKTWENYARSKAKLAKSTIPTGKIIINRDDKHGYEFLREFAHANHKDEQVVTYSVKELIGIKEDKSGIYFQLEQDYFFLPMIGTYNIENAMAVITLSHILGINNAGIAKALKNFRGISGRMELLQSEPYAVVVNFAHNADSLERSLEAAKQLVSKTGKLIVVFGSAGLRDVQKRYDMGEIAARIADVVIITAEDPRTESLYNINSQILEGADRSGGVLVKRFLNSDEYKEFIGKPIEDVKKLVNPKSVFIFDEESVAGRTDAIEFATRIAEKGDLVITEGKGHEQSLCFSTTEYPYTDQEAVLKALSSNSSTS